ncbi:MAG TPA: hypothetical protein VFR44_05335 [Actinomycetota bacterium]|nr:hypothetical protein [Actinomycetota bacterium]
MERTTRTTDWAAWQAAPAASPQKIRWGAVFAGTVLGLGLLALLTALWFALAYGSAMEEIRANLEWYIGISAIVCLFIGGLLSGWLSGVRGAAAGFFNGMAIWAMILIVTLVVGVPSILNVFNLGRVTQLSPDATGGILGTGVDNALWATFWSILGGLLACAVGGAIGGAVTRPANADLAVTPPAVPPRTDVIDDDDVRDEETVTTRRYRAS